MSADYTFRTFTTKTQADAVRAELLHNYQGRIVLEYSNYLEKFVLKCAEEDAKALYYRSQQIAPSGL